MTLRFHPGLLILCIALATPLFAQQWCNLSGAIEDPSAGMVPDAVVSVVNEDSGFRRVTQSQPDGMYSVTSLQPGTYKITVRKDGFRTVVRFGVKLESSQPARLDFQLVVGSVQETITVEGDAPWLHRADPAVGVSIDRDDFENLPLKGHGVQDLLGLAPTEVATPATRGDPGQFTVDGQRPNTNYFTVDGVSANTGVSAGGVPAQPTGGALPGLSAFGTLNSLISLEALQEMRVEVSSSVPQFGRLPGAQVSLSSHAGSNEFHGSVFYGFRYRPLNAADWFENGRQPQARFPFNDFAAGLGGPIRRNRTFFFLSYEGIRMDQGFAWLGAVPSLAARGGQPPWAQSLLNLYPAPTGPDLGNGLAAWSAWSNRPSHLDVGSLRIDQAITSRLTAFARYNLAPSFNEYGSAQVSLLELHAQALTFGLDLLARPDTVLDLRVNSSSARVRSSWEQVDPPLPACSLQPVITFFNVTGGSCDTVVRFTIGGLSEVVGGDEGQRSQSQLQTAPTATLNRGAHSLRLGADFLRLTPTRDDAAGSLSILATDVSSVGNYGGLWIARGDPLHNTARLTEYALFAQDAWRISSRLTATYGLRWEISPPPLSTSEAYFLNPQTGMVDRTQQRIWKNSFRDFAPRLGLALRLDGKGRTVLRAGAGRYYDSSLSIATDLINGGPLTLTEYASGRIAPFDSLLTFGFLPNLRIPIVTQWNGSLDHAFSNYDSVTLGYAGASGRDLIRREIGGLGSSPDIWVALATNDGSSTYNALHAQYRRRLAPGWQATVSYTWSHSLDDGSSDSELYWAGSGVSYWQNPRLPLSQERGSSDFDIRHALNAAFTYEWRGFALDGFFTARTGFPINVLDAGQFMGLSLANAFRPDLVGGQPVWIADPSAPGGRHLNSAAFSMTPNYIQGSLGRNAIAGFGMSQLDLAVRRHFSLGEARTLELRVEAFNALNHPNFGDPMNFLVSPLFGQSTSMTNVMLGTGSPGSGMAPMLQAGGVRSVQGTVRFRF